MKPRYGDRSGQHVLPIHLAAQASTTIDIGMLIAVGQPDANGNLIPNYIQEGRAVFSNPEGPAEPRTARFGGPRLVGAPRPTGSRRDRPKQGPSSFQGFPHFSAHISMECPSAHPFSKQTSLDNRPAWW